MNLLPMSILGAHESSTGVVDFGLYLPNLTLGSKVTVVLRIIHEADQFIQAIKPLDFTLANTPNPAFPKGDYWTVRVDTKATPPAPLPASSKWGQAGTYLYRYVATPANGAPIDFIIDPYAREYGVGDISAVTVGFKDHAWSPKEATWKTPNLKDMVLYELMINEFGSDLQKAVPLLDYLKDLGINGIEVMPVNNVKNTINWGYDTIGYFGVDERFGNRATEASLRLVLFHGDNRAAFLRKFNNLFAIDRLYGVAVQNDRTDLFFLKLMRGGERIIEEAATADNQHVGLLGLPENLRLAGNVGSFVRRHDGRLFALEPQIDGTPHVRGGERRVAARGEVGPGHDLQQLVDRYVGLVDHAQEGIPSPHGKCAVVVVHQRHAGIDAAGLEVGDVHPAAAALAVAVLFAEQFSDGSVNVIFQCGFNKFLAVLRLACRHARQELLRSHCPDRYATLCNTVTVAPVC